MYMVELDPSLRVEWQGALVMKEVIMIMVNWTGATIARAREQISELQQFNDGPDGRIETLLNLEIALAPRGER